MWRCAVMTMRRVAEVNEGEGVKRAWSKQHRGVSQSFFAEQSDQRSINGATGYL